MQRSTLSFYVKWCNLPILILALTLPACKTVSSVGMSLGSTFSTPALTITPNINIPVFKLADSSDYDLRLYFNMGCDFGFFSNADFISDLSYNSYYPYTRVGIFVPFGDENEFGGKFGFHFGFGYGCMIANYKFGDYQSSAVVSTFNLAAGFLVANSIDISYSLRTNSRGANNKLSIGFVYRFEESKK